MTVKKLLLLALLGFSLPAQGEMRIFTDAQGRTLKADVLAATIGTVTAKLENGSTVDIPIRSLSDADQAFIEAWRIHMAKNPNAVAASAATAPKTPVTPVELKVEWSKDRLGAKARAEDAKVGNGIVTPNYPMGGATEDWQCHFKITNPSRINLSDCVMECEVRIKLKGETPQSRTVKQDIKLAPLGPLSTVKADTSKVVLRGTAKQNYVSSRGELGQTITQKLHVTLTMEEIEGVILVFKQDRQIVCRYVSPALRDEK